MEVDQAVNQESVGVSARLASIQWVTLESIQDFCKGHPTQYKTALQILQSGEVRSLVLAAATDRTRGTQSANCLIRFRQSCLGSVAIYVWR
jgi:hypothetical protein